VWNYFVKPVAQPEIVRSLMPLLRVQVSKGWPRHAPRLCITPEQNISNGPSSLSLSRSEQAILKARCYVESHLEDKLSERMLARYCGLSAAYFSRTFKRVTGLSFRAFLPQARVKRAMSLLENESLTVTQACFQAGFSNLSHFTVMFRRYVGLSPSVY